MVEFRSGIYFGNKKIESVGGVIITEEGQKCYWVGFNEIYWYLDNLKHGAGWKIIAGTKTESNVREILKGFRFLDGELMEW